MSAAFLLDSMRSNSPVEFGCAPPPQPIASMGWACGALLFFFLSFYFHFPHLRFCSLLFFFFVFCLY
ncbi:hypothetical protein I7I48_06747 [Histoplasma ohiense]|nr:hypothetical protein I7I48_06747 [Histoplasma ohiense (nom. inval.)]